MAVPLCPSAEYNTGSMKRLLLVLACASTAMAATVTLTMDEVATHTLNGLAVTKGGITFTFSDTGGGLSYNAASGGILTYVQDPSIAGTPEPFGVVFSVPVNFVQFGMVASQTSPAAPIATVNFYNGSTLVTTMTLNSSLTDPYAEGQLTYSSTPVTSMTVTPASFETIGFDNLTVTTAPPPTPVPSVPATSPLTLALMTVGIVGFGGYALRRRFGPSTSY
jgi:hypothetical protein